MENQVVISIVPSRKNEVVCFASDKTQTFPSAAEVAKGFELLKGNNQEVEEWLTTSIPINRRKAVGKRLGFFRDLQDKDVVVCGIMGGLGQSLFARAADMGLNVQRIPMYRLQDLTKIEPKASPEERCQAIIKAWVQENGVFYPLTPVDPSILLARGLARERLGIQSLRKPMQLRFYAALREARYILPSQAELLITLIEEAAKDLFHNKKAVGEINLMLEGLRTLFPSKEYQRLLGVVGHYVQPRFIIGAKEDEEDLEKYILQLIGDLPIWEALHQNGNSKLPAVKGLGPALGGVIIGEIGDIRRFPSASHLRSYARFGLKDGVFPRRKAGEELSSNLQLNQAVWFWSSDQVPRYDHVWRELYFWKKARELQAHLAPVERVVSDKKGRARVVYDFTLKHLDSRAKRWTGSQLLNYLWALWTTLEEGKDAEQWYPSSRWPEYVARVDGELQAGLRAYLEEEIPKRRKREPEEEPEAQEENVRI